MKTKPDRNTREIEAKPVDYDGNHFRSRLELKWYLWLKEVGYHVEYEPKRINTENGSWLPDFLVWYQGRASLLEIKPRSAKYTYDDIRSMVRAIDHSLDSGNTVFVLAGEPSENFGLTGFVDREGELRCDVGFLDVEPRIPNGPTMSYWNFWENYVLRDRIADRHRPFMEARMQPRFFVTGHCRGDGYPFGYVPQMTPIDPNHSFLQRWESDPNEPEVLKPAGFSEPLEDRERRCQGCLDEWCESLSWALDFAAWRATPWRSRCCHGDINRAVAARYRAIINGQ